MARIKVYTTPDCSYCHQAKEWLEEHGCAFDELDITSDVGILREWREISGGEGVPVIAHGKDVMIGFNPHRLEGFVDCCEHTSPVDEASLPKEEAKA